MATAEIYMFHSNAGLSLDLYSALLRSWGLVFNHFPVFLETQCWSVFPEVDAECTGKEILSGFPG